MKRRAQGKPGVFRTRSLVCEWKKHTSKVTTGTPNIPAFPAQWAYGLLRDLPGVPGFIATVACEIIARKLDPSVGGTGPHGLAVRHDMPRQTCRGVHRILPPTFVTIAKRPSYRQQDG